MVSSPLASALAFLLVTACAAQSGDPAKAKAGSRPAVSRPGALRLLEEGELLSRDFVPEERAGLLLEAASSAVPLSPSVSQRWSLQLFALSRNSLEPGNYRRAMQKNALTILARISAMQSARMFRQQDLPDVRDFPNEDVRSSAANVLFPVLWEKMGKEGLSKVEELASWLGATGEYPYAAVGQLTLDVAKSDRSASDRLLMDAISNFPHDPGFLDANWNFTDLILKTRDLIPRSLLRQAITEDIASIKRAEESRKGTSRYEVRGTKGSYAFKSEGPMLVYRLLPVVEQIDPEWAATLKTEFGLTEDPTPSAGEPLRISAAVTPPGRDDSASDADIQAALDRHRWMQSQWVSETDPKAAAQIAMEIADPTLRSVALASVAPEYSKLDSKQSDAWISSARQQLNSLAPSVDSLRLSVALIKANIAKGDLEQTKQQMSGAYDLGEELFEEDAKSNPGKLSKQVAGLDELNDLTLTGARKKSLAATTLDHVRRIRSEELRAWLLMAQAKGTTEQRNEASQKINIH